MLSFVALKKNLLTLLISIVIAALFVVAIIWNMSFLFLIPFVPTAIICFIICFNSYPVIQKYVINPYYERTGETNPELDPLSDSDENEVLFEDKGGSEKPVEKKKSKKGKVIS